MDYLVLTQTGGILRPFGIILGLIMNYIYRFLEMFGISNIALTIVLLTLVVNVLIIPLTYRQQKFSRMNAVINPEIQKITKKYEGKTDERSMRMRQAETQAVYDKYGASPVGGCLPALIQIPILFALYRVIYNVPAYVEPVKQVYEKIATPIMNATGASDIMTDLISTLGIRVSNFDITNANKVVDALYLVKSGAWETVSQAFSASPDVVQAISDYAGTIVGMNWLPGGLSVVDPPLVLSRGIAGAFPGVIIPILAALTQWINMKVTQRNQPQLDTSTQMGSTMNTMNTMMPIMSLFFTTTLPAGMGVYWISSSVFRTLITLVIDKVLARTDIDEIIEKNKDKAEAKAAKRGERQEKLEAYASMNTRKISDIAKASRTENESVADRKETKSSAQRNTASSGKGAKKGGDASGQSISSIANMLKKRDE